MQTRSVIGAKHAQTAGQRAASDLALASCRGDAIRLRRVIFWAGKGKKHETDAWQRKTPGVVQMLGQLALVSAHYRPIIMLKLMTPDRFICSQALLMQAATPACQARAVLVDRVTIASLQLHTALHTHTGQLPPKTICLC